MIRKEIKKARISVKVILFTIFAIFRVFGLSDLLKCIRASNQAASSVKPPAAHTKKPKLVYRSPARNSSTPARAVKRTDLGMFFIFLAAPYQRRIFTSGSRRTPNCS